MSKGVTIVKQGCKKCVRREGTCQLLKISEKMVVKEDEQLIHERCNCYTTHGPLNFSHWLTQIYNGCHWVQNSTLISFRL